MSEPSAAARPLSGKQLAAELRTRTARLTTELTAAGTPPRLAIVSATEDESSAWYVRSLARAAQKSGLLCTLVDLGPQATSEELSATLDRLGTDREVHGIILQTPLPPGVVTEDLTSSIPPAKDVDGANPVSLGRLLAGLPAFAPATAEAVLALLDHHEVPLSGRHAVIVGRSTVVGKPASLLLLARDATVTVCHSRTADLAATTRSGEILVAAAGRAGLITGEHVRPGAVVVDVGTNPTPDGGLTGDVDATTVAATASALTPVPGGVGPVTTALLLLHTAEAARAAGAGEARG